MTETTITRLLQEEFDLILDQFDVNTLQSAEPYIDHGRVRDVQLDDNRMQVRAFVKGNATTPYLVVISLEPLVGDPYGYFEATCTCAVREDCKHAAAVLLTLANRYCTEFESDIDSTLEHLKLRLTNWLERFPSLAAESASPPVTGRKKTSRDTLLFLLSNTPQYSGVHTRVDIIKTRKLKKGGYGKGYPLELADFFYYDASWPDFISDTDRQLLGEVFIQQSSNGDVMHRGYIGHDESGTRLLHALLKTDRCHWEDKDTPALQLGETRDGELAWSRDDDQLQRLRIVTNPPSQAAILCSPPWYVDVTSGHIGPLTLESDVALVRHALTCPAIPPEIANDINLQLIQSGAPIPPLEEVQCEEIVGVTPQPCLHVDLVNADHPLYWQSSIPANTPLLTLYFRYGGFPVDPSHSQAVKTIQREDQLIQLHRRLDDEAAALETLHRFSLEHFPVWDHVEDSPRGLTFVCPVIHPANAVSQQQLLQLKYTTLPALAAAGWCIEGEECLPFEVVSPTSWSVDIGDTPGSDWFELQMGVDIEGERLSFLPILVDVLENQYQGDALAVRAATDAPDTTVFYTLDDERVLAIPGERIKKSLDVLSELYSDSISLNDNEGIMLPVARAGELTHLSENDDTLSWQGGERIRAMGKRLRNFEGIQTIDVPEEFAGTLRAYQQTGLNWLQFLREFEFGGVLADDMGLGKTIQTLAHLCVEKTRDPQHKPSLVIAPTSLMSNWRNEAARFAPMLSTLVLHGSQRHEDYARISESDIVFTTYPLLMRDFKKLAPFDFHYLILDEAQAIKNPRAKTAQLVKKLKAERRLCLTGTPMENHLGELWAIMHFLMPGLLGDQKQFSKLFRTPIEKQQDQQRLQQLRRRLAPFFLRRTKDQVASELPPKTIMTRLAQFDAPQRDLYETIRVAMHKKVRDAIKKKGANRSHIEFLDALLKLRQVCCDPRLVKMASARLSERSAKLELLLELLPELLEEGRRVLLFSQFTSMLSLIEERLRSEDIAYVKLTGRTKDRATPIQRFQDGDVSLFLISLKAGGTGLNLTAADTVIHYDPWWNPAVENQATDRAHRIGQTKPVFVYKLITEGTVEEKIAAMQERKSEMLEGVFSEQAKGGQLNADDFEKLFAPLEAR